MTFNTGRCEVDTLSAFAMGEANRGKPQRVFDWVKAAELIRERRPAAAEAGLEGDWEYTGGVIYRGGAPVHDEYTYLASTWATPQLMLLGCESGGDDTVDCWRWRDETDWHSGTKWPAEALAVLGHEAAPKT